MSVHVESEDNFQSHLSPSTVWVPGIELKSSGLVYLPAEPSVPLFLCYSFPRLCVEETSLSREYCPLSRSFRFIFLECV